MGPSIHFSNKKFSVVGGVGGMGGKVILMSTPGPCLVQRAIGQWTGKGALRSTIFQVVFSNQVCLDCGQVGDERLLSDFCHETRVERDRTREI